MAKRDDGFISTSKLAKEAGIKTSAVFEQLQGMGLITKVGDKWELTGAGKERGGKYLSSARFGTWIAWPKDVIKIESGGDAGEAKPLTEVSASRHLTATTLGKNFGIPATRMNYILSELGWIQKALKGWTITQPGAAVGGMQREDHRSGVPYVVWPDAIGDNSALCSTIDDLQGAAEPSSAGPEEAEDSSSTKSAFRDKFPAKFRTTDGHFVRSRAEILIDNWLYMAEIVHAYERKLPIEEEVYCDFYIPSGKVYIEFWGMEADPRYAERMKAKQDIYAKYGFKLIELRDDDVHNLDDMLPAKLLKFGIQAY